MARLVGTSPNIDGVLNALAGFLVSDGWTQNELINDTHSYHPDSGPGRPNAPRPGGRRLSVQKNGMFFTLRSFDGHMIYDLTTCTMPLSLSTTSASSLEMSGIAITGATGFSAGGNWNEQPGTKKLSYSSTPFGQTTSTQHGDPDGGITAGIATTNQNITQYSYIFDSIGDSINVRLEANGTVRQGRLQGCRWMSFGRINDLGDGWASTNGLNGSYFFASHSCPRYTSSTNTELSWTQNKQDTRGFEPSHNLTGNGAIYIPSYTNTKGQVRSADWVVFDEEVFLGNSSISRTVNRQIRLDIVDSPDANMSLFSGIIKYTPNESTGITPIVPMIVKLCSLRTSTNLGTHRDDNNFRLVGAIPGMFICSVVNYPEDAQETIGSNTFTIKRVSNNTSHNGGIAFMHG